MKYLKVLLISAIIVGLLFLLTLLAIDIKAMIEEINEPEIIDQLKTEFDSLKLRITSDPHIMKLKRLTGESEITTYDPPQIAPDYGGSTKGKIGRINGRNPGSNDL